MTVNSTETEIKYEAAAGVALPAFTDLPQVARAEGAAPEHLAADYFDTDDLRLIRAGITLRRRQGGHDAGWHLKLPAGNHTRREIRLPLGRATQHVPEELARLVRVHTRGKKLKPVARISTARSRLLLLVGDGAELAEVASDVVTAQAVGDAGRVSRWHEVEIELTGGSRDVLDAADRLLQSVGLSRSGQSAKLARALDLPEGGSSMPRKVDAGATAGAVVLSYLETQVSRLKSYDSMVRSKEPDSVHQMRTTSRRLRSTLQAFGNFFSRSQSDELIEELRWLGNELGLARDAEVLRDHLAQRIKQLPAELVVGPVAARVQGHFAAVGADAQAAVLQMLNSPRYFALLDRLDELVMRPVATDRSELPAMQALPPEVRRTYKRTKRRMERGLSLPAGERADIALHEARKAAKRARYAGEAVTSVFGAPAARFTKQMKKLQSVLGEHQDAVIARAEARDLGMAAHRTGENSFTYGVIYGRLDGEMRRLRRQAHKTWRSASKPRVTIWLG
ncbi:MAG: CYTH and CHAD domain-containing protein [Streptosporangiaceae bacterium]